MIHETIFSLGTSKSELWSKTIPSNLTLGGVEVNPRGVAGAFAGHFNEKIMLNVSRTKVDVRGVYNGKCKLIVQNQNFMTENDVKKYLCMYVIKLTMILINKLQ